MVAAHSPTAFYKSLMVAAHSPTANRQENNPENRWTLPFKLAVHKAFDAIEEVLASDPDGTPASLLTISESPK